MSVEIKEFRIFMASPNGLAEERQAFRNTLVEYNRMDARERGVSFWPIGWEDALGGVGRPQSIINDDIRTCDYFVMVLWDRWGSRPDKPGEGKWSSATEEEYHIAVECLDDAKMPMKDIVVFFKAVDAGKLSDPGPQLQRVLEFKKNLEEEKALLFHTYDEVPIFGNLLRRHLARWIRHYESRGDKRIENPQMPPGIILGGSEVSGMAVGREPQAPEKREMNDSLKEAWQLADQGRLTDAEAKFAELAVMGTSAEALTEYSWFLRRVGRLTQAEEMREKSLEIDEKLNRLEDVASDHGNLGDAPADRGDVSRRSAKSESIVLGAGMQVGPYKLLEVSGKGTFGVVYLAEQRRPVRRRVALKVIKPGMDTKQVIARFEAERQALAFLDHPNIAKVFDAGTSEAGRPYFAMEYIKGVPITEHCDSQKLTVEERLKLFMKVCEAIQHAHQKGIIHRDIKPSNILVYIQDEQAVPKVIDFGVAKALTQPLTERTLVTGRGQMLGTPEYISPEQAEMTNLDIDTRSDIYSLGVLLYKLLTGTLPFESQTLRKGSLEHMRQVIREAEPKIPSVRVSSLDAEASTKLARYCQSDAAALRRKLHGDLDWITLKAMEKERKRRYQTAHALAEDIERHLKQEPILAGRPGPLYRLEKLVRRNKGISAATAIVAVVLVLGACVSTWQAVRATRLRHKADTLAYTSDMSLAQYALDVNDLGRAQRLLEDHRPAPGEVDLRGWEWRYLWLKCRNYARELHRYPNSTYSVAYSHDGKLLAVAGMRVGESFVDIWDVPGGTLNKRLQEDKGHLVAFAPRRDLLATNASNEILLYETDSLVSDSLAQLPDSCKVVFLKFSPDGTRLASLLQSPDTVTVWDVDQQTVVCRIGGVSPSATFIGALDFSPDGRSLVIGDIRRCLQVVDLPSGKTRFEIPKAHPDAIFSVAWSPTDDVIACGGGYKGGPIQLWNSVTGKSVGELKGHSSWISELIFSKDGRRLYSASADQTIRVWEVKQQRLEAILRGSSDEVWGAALSPDGTTLASSSKDGVVAFWSAKPEQEEPMPRVIPISSFAQPVFAPDSRVLAVSQAGAVSLLDLTTFNEPEKVHELGTLVSSIAYSPDGTLLVSGSYDGEIRVWSCAERRRLRALGNHTELISLLCFRANGRRLLSIDIRGKAIWWDTLMWQPRQTFKMSSFSRGAVSPNGRLLAIAARCAVKWLDAETGDILSDNGTVAHLHYVQGIAFSEDGSRAASVGEDGTLAIWDTSSFQLLTRHPFKCHMHGAHAVAFSPDGRRLVVGSGAGREAIKLWDLSTQTPRELMSLLPGQGSMFSFVAFSPDGRWLAARSGSNLHLWRAPSWDEIETAEKKSESGHSP